MFDKRKYDGLSTDEKLNMVLESIEQLLEAFPDGIAAHRQAHQAWIDAKNAEVKFWQELKLDIAKKGLWGLLTMLVGLVVVGVTVSSQRWFH